MIATLLSLFMKYVVPGLADDALQALSSFVTAEIAKRDAVAQGQAQQHTADLEASLKDAKNAAEIQESVDRDSAAQLDAGLERVRNNATASSQ